MISNNIETLIIISTQIELNAFIKAYNEKGMYHKSVTLGSLELNNFTQRSKGKKLQNISNKKNHKVINGR